MYLVTFHHWFEKSLMAECVVCVCVCVCVCCGLLAAEAVAQLIPEADSPAQERVQQYRQLLDELPMDAYTHGCILHPELTTDSMIPKYATAEIRSE